MMFGNLSIKQIEEKLCISFPDELKELMLNTRQEDVSKKIESGKWHCFHLPFCLVCGGKEFATKIYQILLPLQPEMKGELKIAWQ